ncbi:glutaminyl-peptide cyclotransferase [Corynebacterium bovis]|uniref:glutaminyl-peptide cyclotransferase n=1 Tax=Corynebacterium bovis TaxID=36808 RepID=UPI00254A4721|nr:glutaminyl-peptide cyclotransferase [Corynebacterium bovis]MDK8511359.1 glutaminyl-peptide cyclotransferase [Corynebacterium bovis]
MDSPPRPARRAVTAATAATATVVLRAVLAACGTAPPPPSTVPTPRVEVVATHPFDPTSFTQGLDVAPDGSVVVGTGLTGRSRIYRTTPDGRQSDSRPLDPGLFGEGVAVAGDTVWQLTWTDGTAIRRDARTLAETGRVPYDGEGWGLCFDGRRLIMSDGSADLTFRDPVTFAETGRVTVRRDGEPVRRLNELDCAEDGTVLANVWQTDTIERIAPDTGEVTAEITADLPRPADADVLNGIAHIPGTDRMYLTGKLWDTLYEVRVTP